MLEIRARYYVELEIGSNEWRELTAKSKAKDLPVLILGLNESLYLSFSLSFE